MKRLLAIALAGTIYGIAPSRAAYDHGSYMGPTAEARHAQTVHVRVARHHRRQSSSRRARPVLRSNAVAAVILPHPSGCPSRAFCGCGASVEVYGHSVRRLWLAAAWYSFPRSSPAPGMVAVRRHHVFVLRSQIGGNVWLVADHNSGGHRSRLHARNIAGLTIVNPLGRYARL